MLVVDASVLVTALVDDDADGDEGRGRLRGEDLAAPELIDLEVVSALRRAVSASAVPPRRAALAIDDLISMPLLRAPHHRLLTRCWELRENLTPYDAVYVALAEALGAPLLTADARMASAPGIRCEVEILASSRDR